MLGENHSYNVNGSQDLVADEVEELDVVEENVAPRVRPARSPARSDVAPRRRSHVKAKPERDARAHVKRELGEDEELSTTEKVGWVLCGLFTGLWGILIAFLTNKDRPWGPQSLKYTIIGIVGSLVLGFIMMMVIGGMIDAAINGGVVTHANPEYDMSYSTAGTV